MFRRVVSLLLLLCVLLTQLATTLAHAHCGSQPAGHDLRPHVHTNSALAGPRHDHNAGDHNHGHGGHHDDVLDDVAPDARGTPLATSPAPPSDHDADAIYVNATDAVAAERSEVLNGSSDLWTASACGLFAKAGDHPPARPVVCGHPPPQRSDSCPLYVKHLALLI